MHPRKFIRDSIGYAFAQYVVRATLMLRGLIAARVLGPYLYGAWNAIQIVTEYGSLAPSGSQQGLDQMVPPRIVSGDAAGLDRVKRAALFNIALLSGLFAMGCLLLGTFGHSRMLHWWGLAGIGAAMVCAISTNLANYQTSIMRSHGDITTASLFLTLQGAVGGILGLALLPWMKAWGLLFGWMVGCLVALIFSSVRSRTFAPLVPRPAAESIDLVQIGFPMYVYLASTIVMRNLDRLIILRYLSTDALGYYSLSVMALAFLLYVPDSVSYVLYPQLLREYGASGRRPEAIRPRVERVLQASSIMVPAMCGVAFVLAPTLVALVLPKFVPGVGALRVLCFGAAALAFSNLASNVLMTVERQMVIMPAAVFAVVVYAALDLAAVKLGYGIQGVAWATLSSYALSSAVLVSLAFGGLGLPARAVFATVGRLFAPLVVALLLVNGLDRVLPWAGSHETTFMILRPAVALASFLLLYALAIRPLTRGMGLRAVLAEVDVPVIGGLVRRLTGGRREGA